MQKSFKNYEKTLNILLLVSICFVLIFNLFTYDPILGYDAEAHHTYVDYMAVNKKLPGEGDTYEYFSPPIAYVFPAGVSIVCQNLVDSPDIFNTCRTIYPKITQIFQTILYLTALIINLKTIKLFTNSDNLFSTSYLLLISLGAINYRSISMIRGEVYIILFLSILLYLYLKLIKNNFNYSENYVLYFGLTISLLALSRQWAFFLFPGFFIVAILYKNKKLFLFLAKSFSLGAAFSIWFYFRQFLTSGTFTAFNKTPMGLSFNNQPLSFYVPTSENLNYLFFKPIRPWLDNQFLSILYSDFWGDYWGYFVFTSRHLEDGRNQLFIGDYLARVNLVSILPTIFILFFLFQRNRMNKEYLLKYINLSIAITFFGYLLFLIIYPELPTGDTIKSTYMLQLFHLILFITAVKIDDYKYKNFKLYNLVILFFLIAYVHNFSTYLSHYNFEFIRNLA
jgi:hypothetical protein